MKLGVFGESAQNGNHFLFFCYAKQYNEFIKTHLANDRIIRLKIVGVKEGLFEVLQHQGPDAMIEYIEPILKEGVILHSN